MSLKDQVRWALQRPWRAADGRRARWRPRRDPLGDALRELAAEYNRALRYVAGAEPRRCAGIAAAPCAGATPARERAGLRAAARGAAVRDAGLHARGRGARARTRAGVAARRRAGRALRAPRAAARCACTARSSAAATAAPWRRSAERNAGTDRERRSGANGTVLQRPPRLPGRGGGLRFGRILGKRFTRNNLAPARAGPRGLRWPAPLGQGHPRPRRQHLHAVGGRPRRAGQRGAAGGDPARPGRARRCAS